MKKAGLSIALFLAAFAAAYWHCCYGIPGWRIKLEADPMTYFIKSIKYMALVKSLIALAVGLAAGAIPVIIRKIFRR